MVANAVVYVNFKTDKLGSRIRDSGAVRVSRVRVS